MERHRLDLLALFSGLVFVAVALLGLTDAVELHVTDLRWLAPLALVAFGAVLLITAVGRRDRGAAPGDAGPNGADAGEDDDTGPEPDVRTGR